MGRVAGKLLVIQAPTYLIIHLRESFLYQRCQMMMLPAWIIEKQRRDQQRKDDRASWDRQPHLELPLPQNEPKRPIAEDVPERGSVSIDYMV